MRPISSALLDKIKKAQQTIYHNAEPGMIITVNGHYVSGLLETGSISTDINNSVSTLNLTLANKSINTESVSLIEPLSEIKLWFTAGDSEPYPMGVFYADKPEFDVHAATVSIQARNTIGKRLSDQTFDETRYFTGTWAEVVTAILEYAGVESCFVEDDSMSVMRMTFDPDQTILSGIEELLKARMGHRMQELTDGQIGIAPHDDPVPSTYIMTRDTDLFSRRITHDDHVLYARVCVSYSSRSADKRVYRNIPNIKYPVAAHKTYHTRIADLTTPEAADTYAEELADWLSSVGTLETLAGPIRPQLTIRDSVEIIGEGYKGDITAITHSFVKPGYVTEITVDSGGWQGKPKFEGIIQRAVRRANYNPTAGDTAITVTITESEYPMLEWEVDWGDNPAGSIRLFINGSRVISGDSSYMLRANQVIAGQIDVRVAAVSDGNEGEATATVDVPAIIIDVADNVFPSVAWTIDWGVHTPQSSAISFNGVFVAEITEDLTDQIRVTLPQSAANLPEQGNDITITAVADEFNTEITAAVEIPIVGLPAGGLTNQIIIKQSEDDYDVDWGDAVSGTGGIPGGTTGQVLTKQSDADFDADWEEVPPGVPEGGITGQALVKQSNDDYDVTWHTISGTGGSLPPPTSAGDLLTLGSLLEAQWSTPKSVLDGISSVDWLDILGGEDMPIVPVLETITADEWKDIFGGEEKPIVDVLETVTPEEWDNILSGTSIQGPEGPQGVSGVQGPPGPAGEPGEQVDLTVSGTLAYVDWKGHDPWKIEVYSGVALKKTILAIGEGPYDIS